MLAYSSSDMIVFDIFFIESWCGRGSLRKRSDWFLNTFEGGNEQQIQKKSTDGGGTKHFFWGGAMRRHFTKRSNKKHIKSIKTAQKRHLLYNNQTNMWRNTIKNQYIKVSLKKTARELSYRALEAMRCFARQILCVLSTVQALGLAACVTLCGN